MENKQKLMEYMATNNPINPNVVEGLVDGVASDSGEIIEIIDNHLETLIDVPGGLPV